MNFFCKESTLLTCFGLLFSSSSYSSFLALDIFCQNGRIRNDNALNLLLSNEDEACSNQKENLYFQNNQIEIEHAFNHLHYVDILYYSEFNKNSDITSRLLVDCDENKLVEVEKTVTYQENG